MKKLIIYVSYFIVCFSGILTLLILSIGVEPFSSCNISCNAGKFSITGTYYLQKSDGNIDNNTFIVIENGDFGDKLDEGNWHDSDGLKGKYQYSSSSGKINFYDEGIHILILSGNIKDNKLVIEVSKYSSTTYVKR